MPALHAQLLGGPPKDAADSARAARNYEVLAKDAPARSPWQGGLTAQIFLGDADFAARMQALASASQTQATDIPRSQRLPALSFSLCLQRFGERAQALQMVHVEGGLSMSALAREIGLSISRVSGLIASTRGGVCGGGGGKRQGLTPS